jgi:pimeloyl-ACP methyl ester carboxylesterase
MAEKRAALLVGLMGGSLYSTFGPNNVKHREWVQIPQLVATGIGVLRLGLDGESAGPPSGKELLPGGPDDSTLGGYYQDGVADLRENAPDDSWTVQALPYDWRKDELKQAANVAGAIIQGVEQEGVESWTLCGHSQGGIIAILAYTNLMAKGKASYIRRIVTVCSPLYGLWCCPLTLAGVSPQLAQMAGFRTYTRDLPPYDYTDSSRFCADLSANWPAFYQLFPSQFSRKPSDNDNFTAAYVTSSYFSENHIHGDWLLNAYQFNAALENAIQAIPPEVMVAITSKGVYTPWNSNVKRYVPGMTYEAPFTSGDGTVVYEDQFSPRFDHFDTNGWVHSEAWNLAGRSELLSALAYRWQRGQPLSDFQLNFAPPPAPVIPWPNFAIIESAGQAAQNSKLGYQPAARAFYKDP